MTFRLFALASALAVLHAFDDAFLLPPAGVPLTQHALAFALAAAATALAISRFRSLRPGLQSLVALIFGLLAAVNGGRHVHHVVNGALTANDVTGLLAAAAAVTLLGLAAWIPFASRGSGSWPARVLVPPAVLVFTWLVLMPVGMGIVDIHSLHRGVGSPPSGSWRTAAFRTSDGLRLEGWYRPSRNGASVLMVSGGGANRRSTLRHARMLERHGYGVLVYDPRGSGNSEGSVNSYGWGWDKDLDAALGWLARRPDVHDGRIGALGLSTGADMVIDAAGRRPDLRGVVADGSAWIGYEDVKEYTSDPLQRAGTWLMFTTISVIQGRPWPKTSLASRVAHARAPELLISANKAERDWGELYDRRGGDRTELWYLPHASHTAALRQYPAEYEQRVTAFFDRHLR
jgi:uncharacterized protein